MNNYLEHVEYDKKKRPSLSFKDAILHNTN